MICGRRTSTVIADSDGAPDAGGRVAVGTRRWTRSLLWLVAAIIVAVTLRASRGEWRAATATLAELRLDWALVAASTAVVLMNYALLVELWRRVLQSLGERLGWSAAAQIWGTSNLARYLPGAFWQIGALSVLARRRHVSATVATGSALLVTLINTVAGIGLALATGGYRDGGALPLVVCLVGIAGAAALPALVPAAERLACVVLRRDISIPRLSHRVVCLVAVGSVVSWALYGLAFQLLDRAVFGGPQAAPARFVAAYTASYLTGLFSPTPAGVGVSDSVLANLYATLGLGPLARGLVIAAVSRVWRTALEVLPGVAIVVASAAGGGSARRRATERLVADGPERP